MTVVSFKHRMIFLKTRKTGGTSVELWLSSIAGRRDIHTEMDPGDEALRRRLGGAVRSDVPLRRYRLADLAQNRRGRLKYVSHMPAHRVRQFVGPSVWDSFLKVTVERDRYERAMSMYRFKTRGLTDPPSLTDFLRRFPAYKLANASVYSIGDEVVADVVLDYARLEDDVAALQRHLGVPVAPLPRAKVFSKPAKEGVAEMSDEARRLVDSICQYDVALTLPGKRLGGWDR